ncbi:MAG: DNA internalization-related competence protein ComEC/Rec2 [Myxococcota bacterium]
MAHSPTIILFATGFLGCYGGFFGHFSSNLALIISSVCAVAALVAPHKVLRATLVMLAVWWLCCLSAICTQQQYNKQKQRIPQHAVVYEGTVNDIAPSLQRGKRAVVHVTGFLLGNERQALAFTLLLRLHQASSALNIAVGDRIRVFTRARPLRHSLTPGEFDSYLFGLARNIHAKAYIRDPVHIAVMKRNAAWQPFARARAYLRKGLMQLLTPREAGVLLALLVGDTQLFDQQQHMLYRRVGASHLLAVSGLQVSLLAFALFRFLHMLLCLTPVIGRLSYARSTAACLALIAVWAFVGLCGAPPSCVRAAAMASALLLGGLTTRKISTLDALGVAGFCTVMLSPVATIDPSFLLSYAAIVGLMLCPGAEIFTGSYITSVSSPDAQGSPQTAANTTAHVKRLQALGLVAFASFAAGLMTLPLTAHLFGEVVPAGLITNVILVPVASFLQVPALVLGCLGALGSYSSLAHAGAWFAAVLEALCDVLGNMVGDIVPIESPSRTATLGYFVSAFLLLLGFLRKNLRHLIVSICLSFACFAIPLYVQPSGVRISVLAVGQGDSSVFELPSGHVLLIDGGGAPQSDWDPGERIVLPFLARRGIKHIDVMVVTHPDADHILGLMAVLQNMSVGSIWHSGFEDEHPLMGNFLRLAKQKNVPVFHAKQLLGSHCFGNTRIDVLAPHPVRQHELLYKELKTNDNSLVLHIHHGNDSALWPGDIEEWGEYLLLQNDCNLQSSVLKAPHHGSRTSSTPAFVHAVQAQHVVFCTGQDNRFGFPHQQTLQRFAQTGAHVWDSGKNGQTTFWLTGNGVVVKSFR